ncbi:hypothetical protein HRI_004562100 [Hibiscus trionum]|uniref:Uncharacterized protein n=1 Tax=Hibiscus trionum TaxID=183268 RepID=A0A9W7J8R1_HIBTR|nr:hypothetical protein HRI_004562100 [Hibiscus trionum]
MKIDGEYLIELIGSCRNKVQVYRSVRMHRLHTSLHFHLTPIGQRIPCLLGSATGGSREVGIGDHSSWGKGPLNALTSTPDMDRTVSQRSEPSSCIALRGEQPNPWNILQPQVAKSRHRGAKPSRRFKLPYAFALEGQSPPGPRKPLHASVTFFEAYAP